MASLGTAFVELGIKDQKLLAGLQRSERQLDKFSRSVHRISRRAQIATAALTGSITLLTRRAAQYGDQIMGISRSTGIAAESVQALGYAASQSNADLATLTTGLRSLTRRTAEAARGNQMFARGFEQLGVSVVTADGHLKDTEALLLELADATSQMGSEAEMSAALMRVMGDAGRQLVPFMKQGAGSIEDLMQQARELGIVTSETSIRGLAQFNDQMRSFQDRVEGVGREIAVQFVGPLTVLNRWLGVGIDYLQNMDQETRNTLTTWIMFGGALLAGVGTFGVLASGALLVVKSLSFLGAAAAIIMSPLVLKIGLVAAAAYLLHEAWTNNWLGIQDATEKVWKAISPTLDTIRGWGRTVIRTAWEWTIRGLNALNELVDVVVPWILGVPEVVTNTWKWLLEKFAEWNEVWGMAVDRVIEWVIWVSRDGWDYVREFVNQTVDFVANIIRQGWDIAKHLSARTVDFVANIIRQGWDIGKYIVSRTVEIIANILRTGWDIGRYLVGRTVEIVANVIRRGWDIATYAVNRAVEITANILRTGWDIGSYLVSRTVDFFANVIRRGWDIATEFYGRTVDFFAHIVRTGWDYATEFVDRVASFVVEVRQQVQGAFREYYDQFIEWIIDIHQRFQGAFKEYHDRVVDWTIRVYQQASDAIQDYRDRFISWVIQVYQQAETAIEDYKSRFVRWVIDVVQRARGVVEEYSDRWIGWLIDVSQQTTGKIQDYRDEFVDWVIRVQQRFRNAVQEYHDQVVRWSIDVAQRFRQQITEYKDQAVAWVIEVSQRLITTVEDYRDRVIEWAIRVTEISLMAAHGAASFLWDWMSGQAKTIVDFSLRVVDIAYDAAGDLEQWLLDIASGAKDLADKTVRFVLEIAEVVNTAPGRAAAWLVDWISGQANTVIDFTMKTALTVENAVERWLLDIASGATGVASAVVEFTFSVVDTVLAAPGQAANWLFDWIKTGTDAVIDFTFRVVDTIIEAGAKADQWLFDALATVDQSIEKFVRLTIDVSNVILTAPHAAAEWVWDWISGAAEKVANIAMEIVSVTVTAAGAAADWISGLISGRAYAAEVTVEVNPELGDASEAEAQLWGTKLQAWLDNLLENITWREITKERFDELTQEFGEEADEFLRQIDDQYFQKDLGPLTMGLELVMDITTFTVAFTAASLLAQAATYLIAKGGFLAKTVVTAVGLNVALPVVAILAVGALTWHFSDTITENGIVQNFMDRWKEATLVGSIITIGGALAGVSALPIVISVALAFAVFSIDWSFLDGINWNPFKRAQDEVQQTIEDALGDDVKITIPVEAEWDAGGSLEPHFLDPNWNPLEVGTVDEAVDGLAESVRELEETSSEFGDVALRFFGDTTDAMRGLWEQAVEAVQAYQQAVERFDITDDDLTLMAKLAEAEAQCQGVEGMVAVIETLLNRVTFPGHYGSTPEGAVHASGAFCPVGNGAMDQIEVPIDNAVKAVAIALSEFERGVERTSGALYFANFAIISATNWMRDATRFTKLVDIGDHTFGTRGPNWKTGTPWTGSGSPNEVAGVVHHREAVIPWTALQNGPQGVLDFLGVDGFQAGKTAPVAKGSDIFGWIAGQLVGLVERIFGEGFTERISETWDSVSDMFDELMGSVGELGEAFDEAERQLAALETQHLTAAQARLQSLDRDVEIERMLAEKLNRPFDEAQFRIDAYTDAIMETTRSMQDMGYSAEDIATEIGGYAEKIRDLSEETTTFFDDMFKNRIIGNITAGLRAMNDKTADLFADIGSMVSFTVGGALDITHAIQQGISMLTNKLMESLRKIFARREFDKEGQDRFPDLAQLIRNYDNFDEHVRRYEQIQKELGLGTIGGGAAGGGIGAGIGSIFGPIGTVIGGLLGGLIGSWAGDKLISKRVEEELQELEEALGVTMQEIKEILGTDLSSVAGNLRQAFSADTFSDFVDDFGLAIERQTRDALITAFLGGEVMRPLLEQLSNIITQFAITGDESLLGDMEDIKRKIADIAEPFFEAIKDMGRSVQDEADAIGRNLENSLLRAFSADTYRQFSKDFGWAVEDQIKQSLIKSFTENAGMKGLFDELEGAIGDVRWWRYWDDMPDVERIIGDIIGYSEDLYKIIDMMFDSTERKLGDITRTLGQGLRQAFSADTFEGFVDSFSLSLENAVRDAMITAFLDSAAIKPLMDMMTGIIEDIALDGYTEERRNALRNIMDSVTDASGALYELLLDLGIATEHVKDEFENVSESFRNVPRGFKVALERFSAADPSSSVNDGVFRIPTPVHPGETFAPAVHVHFEGDVYGAEDLERKIVAMVASAKKQDSMAQYGLSRGW